MSIEPAFVLRFIISCAKLTSTWPLRSDATVPQRFMNRCQWLFSVMNVIGLLIPLLLGAYYYRSDTLILMKILSESTALTLMFFNLILLKWQEEHMRILFDEVVLFMMTINDGDNLIFQRRLNRYVPIWTFGIILFSMTAAAFSFGPLITSELLPGTTWYPFEIKPFTMRHYFFYVQHVVTIFQAGLGTSTEIAISFLFCYLSVKLEILKNRINMSRTSGEVFDCFREHENCIRFFKLLNRTLRLMMLKNNWLMMMTIIFGAIPLLSKQSWAESSPFILIIITSYLRIYMNVWPADDVREMSQSIATAIYGCSWIDTSKSTQKSISFAICRAQKPLVVSIPGLLSPVTLQFYASFVSTTLSYFTALRAAIRS